MTCFLIDLVWQLTLFLLFLLRVHGSQTGLSEAHSEAISRSRLQAIILNLIRKALYWSVFQIGFLCESGEGSLALKGYKLSLYITSILIVSMTQIFKGVQIWICSTSLFWALHSLSHSLFTISTCIQQYSWNRMHYPAYFFMHEWHHRLPDYSTENSESSWPPSHSLLIFSKSLSPVCKLSCLVIKYVLSLHPHYHCLSIGPCHPPLSGPL